MSKAPNQLDALIFNSESISNNDFAIETRDSQQKIMVLHKSVGLPINE